MISKDRSEVNKVENPYEQVTPNRNQKNIRVISRLSNRETDKKSHNFSNIDTDRVSTAAISRLFDRPQTHLAKYNNGIIESSADKNNNVQVSTERGTTAFSKRKIYHPPIKSHELPNKNPFFNRSIFEESNKTLLNKTFDWKKVGAMKHVQERMKKRLQYIVSVERSTDQKLIQSKKRVPL